MNQPIYEIPVTPPGETAGGWVPGTPVPLAEPQGRAFDGFGQPPLPAAGYPAPQPASGYPTPVADYPAPTPATAYAAPAPAPAYAAPAPSPATAYAAPAPAPATAYAAPAPATAYPAPAPSPATAYAAPAPVATPPDVDSSADAFERSFSVTTPVGQSTPRLVPEGRRAADIEPDLAVPSVDAAPVAQPAFEIDDSLSDPEREALENADPELVLALQQVVLQKASDLHLTVGAPPMVRVDGGLRPVGSVEPWDHEKVLHSLHSLLTPQQAEMFKRELELDFAFTISEKSRFRVNFYVQRGSIGAAFRLIPIEIKQLGELGVPEGIGAFSQLPRGLVLVTGPTGSGKSTTLAALIDLVNSTRADHIVTVEDPIEFMHTHKKSLVNQREVGHDTHSFGAALKHVLRQDPDVILIGELRDLETISVALTAAETGHLVFATLHTQDAPQTIDRVIDVFPPHQQDQVRAQLAATLQGVVCQTLVKKANGKGRVVATEVLITTPAIANLIREGKTYQISSMMQAGRNSGMHTMDQHLADLVNTGLITHKAAVDKAHDPEGIGRLIQRVESPADASARAMSASGPDYGDSFSTGAQ
jgi:twitching motility protein PilT